jgi:hypothetical protein
MSLIAGLLGIHSTSGKGTKVTVTTPVAVPDKPGKLKA